VLNTPLDTQQKLIIPSEARNLLSAGSAPALSGVGTPKQYNE